MTEATDNIEISHAELTIGDSLKSAREEKNISISEVATHLMLTKETISALESEHWDQLHGRAYARGYVLSYVRFLGLPEQEALSSFNASYTAPEVSTTKVVNEKRAFPFMPLLFLALVVLMTWFAYEHWRKSTSIDENQQLSTEQENINLSQLDIADMQSELTSQQNDTLPLIDN